MTTTAYSAVGQRPVATRTDYVKALELFFAPGTPVAKGETRYLRPGTATNQEHCRSDTQHRVSKHLSLPDSELQFALNARNFKRIDFALLQDRPTRDVRFIKNLDQDEGEEGQRNWVQRYYSRTTAVKTWSKNLEARADTAMTTNLSANLVSIEENFQSAPTCL